MSRSSNKPIAQIIDLALGKTEKTQRQIAHEIGYDNANMILLFKRGLSRVPLGKAPALAQALGLDPHDFALAAFREYHPDGFAAIEEVHGGLPTRNEMEILSVLRAATNNTDPKLETDEQRQKLMEFARTLRPASPFFKVRVAVKRQPGN